MSDNVAPFPQPIYRRWKAAFPDAGKDPQAEGGGPCRECGQTFAWYGYGGLCAWCLEEEEADPERQPHKLARLLCDSPGLVLVGREASAPARALSRTKGRSTP
jgi:hypothetical protein